MVHFSNLIEKELVPIKIFIGKDTMLAETPSTAFKADSVIRGSSRSISVPAHQKLNLAGDFRRVPLITVCLARSGDKGDCCNIGNPLVIPWYLNNINFRSHMS
jgi:hypothetical protein